MKDVPRKPEPVELTTYRNAAPESSWEQMRDNALFDGPAAYTACRTQLISDQGGLCAFCEISIHENDPLKCRVEHFHPKADISPEHNWALDWNNLLAVCSGGSWKHAHAPYALEPLSENLSCDAHKDRMIQAGRLPLQCEGWIINPLHLPQLSLLFRLERSTGKLFPNEDACTNFGAWPDNQHQDVTELVQHTIEMLNLNCERLATARLIISREIERNKKRQRDAGFNAQQGLKNLAERYFRQRWPGFFTTIRLCLGTTADQHLTDHGYGG
ncbi:retron system putative HNH endonuclease [Pseudomonas sp. Irchel 3A7]|uniref:retron system putative HNH endonuclease n=1 Tax=Pseudomonas sp. Irchel 3A7 TaxID=2008913 RepID=UPI001482F1CF|nr:retron system putative HNH endonuclease [Pseudomonas sp. Irchel 3A7]